MSDSEDYAFVTQSTFCDDVEFNESDIDSQFDNLLEEDLSTHVEISDGDLLSIPKAVKECAINPTEDDNIASDIIRPNFCLETSDGENDNSLDVHKSTRFAKPMTDDEISTFAKTSRNVNTEKKARWALRLFESWFRERNAVAESSSLDCLHMMDMTDNELNKCLVSFVTEVRNQSGGEYHGNTIHEILMSLQYILRQQGREINFQTDFQFKSLMTILDAKMKMLAKNGIGIAKKQADIISTEQEDKLWEGHFLGDSSAQQLLDTVIYLNGLCFCLRGGAEHRELRIGENGNLKIVVKDGVKHLKYTEGVTKTNNGGLKAKSFPVKCVVIGPNTVHPNRCPVRIHEKYMSLRPSSPDAFYLRPLRYEKAGQWYAEQAIGRQPLGETVKRLCAKAGFKGYFTNHSLRATTATRLYEHGVDEQLIAERTGHRSLAIRGYKRTSDRMLSMVDAIVQRKITCTESSPEVKEKSSADMSITVEKDGAKVTFKL